MTPEEALKFAVEKGCIVAYALNGSYAEINVGDGVMVDIEAVHAEKVLGDMFPELFPTAVKDEQPKEVVVPQPRRKRAAS